MVLLFICLCSALVDRALRARELGEETGAPAQDEEFVLSHCDNVQATGFVEHLKLPHYVDFQAELAPVRMLRAEFAERASVPDGEATRISSPERSAASSNEWHTLLPSPTHATVRPVSEPKRCRMVRRSARAWHGWASSERRLTTGTVAAWANRITLECSNTRAASSWC